MALSFYTAVAESLIDAGFDWVSDDFRLLIFSAYTFSAADDFRDDIIVGGSNPGTQVSGTGYTTNTGLAFGSKTASAANPCVLSAADINIAQSGGGFSNGLRYVAYKNRAGAPTADDLFCYGTAGASFGNVAGALTLDVPVSFITVQV